MTTTVWIIEIMKDIKNFMGVYSVNNIQNPVTYPAYLIVNFAESNAPGTHFVAIIFTKDKTSIYFDPLDLIFIPLKIQEYMNKNSRKTHVIHHPIQNPISGYCGFFCLLAILFYVNDIPFIHLTYYFPRSSLVNDRKCITLLVKLFKIYYLEHDTQ